MRLMLGLVAGFVIGALAASALFLSRPAPTTTLTQICIDTIADFVRETSGAAIEIEPGSVEIERLSELDYTYRVDYNSRLPQGGSVAGRGSCIVVYRGDPAAPTARRRPHFLLISVNGEMIDQAYFDAASDRAKNAVY